MLAESSFKGSVEIDSTSGNFEYRINYYNPDSGFNLSIIKGNGKIAFYNIESKETKIVTGFQLNGRASCYSDNKGNYYLVIQNGMIIEHYKENSPDHVALVKRYDLPSSAPFSTYIFWPDAINLPFRIDNGGNMVLTLLPEIRVPPKERYTAFLETFNFAMFHLDAEVSIGKPFATFPKKYRAGFYHDLQGSHPLATYIGDSMLCYTFDIEPVIYSYNFKADKTYSYTVRGLKGNDLKEADITKLSQGIQYTKQYSVENNRNAAFLYDNTGKFVIIRSLKTNYINDDGTLNEYLDKKLEINVIDRATHTVRKKILLANNGRYLIFQAFTRNGLLYLPRVVNDNNEPLIADTYEI